MMPRNASWLGERVATRAAVRAVIGSPVSSRLEVSYMPTANSGPTSMNPAASASASDDRSSSTSPPTSTTETTTNTTP